MGTWQDDPTRNPLSAFARDVTSQFGEDGILARALDVIGDPVGWAVEFGAHDGLTNANTHALESERDFRRVLIEPDDARFEQLEGVAAERGLATAVKSSVGWGEDDSLDAILAQTECPREFDVLSVDIDGNDYHAWAAVHAYTPRIVIIEFNPTIPTGVDFAQPADPDVNCGNSIDALARLGKEKGYALVATTPINAVFVRAKYFGLFEIADNSVATMRTHTECVTQMFHGQDGVVRFVGHRQLVWHGVPMDEARMQPLPDYLRRHPDMLGQREQETLRRIRALAHGETPEPART